jgi:hypothetical protein
MSDTPDQLERVLADWPLDQEQRSFLHGLIAELTRDQADYLSRLLRDAESAIINCASFLAGEGHIAGAGITGGTRGDGLYKFDHDDAQQQYGQVWSEIDKRVSFAKASPDPGFNPLTATDQDLESYKLPPRPDARSSPRSYENWRRAMSPPLRFVSTQVLAELSADLKQAFTIAVGRRQSPRMASDSAALSNNWSGAYIRSDLGETYDLIQGTWIVPQPYPPPPRVQGGPWSHGDFTGSVWIGLDGHDGGSLSLPQLGTTQQVSVARDTTDPADLSVTVSAWWQWWFKDDPNAHEVDLPSTLFSVQPGEVVYAQLNVINPTTVRAFFKNLSSGQVYPPFDLIQPTVTVSNPAGPVKVEGKTAAWIVERQTKPMSAELLPFCDYGQLLFSGCNAQLVTKFETTAERQLQRARLIKMSDWTLPNKLASYQPGMVNLGIIVSTPALQGDDGVLVTYTGNIG